MAAILSQPQCVEFVNGQGHLPYSLWSTDTTGSGNGLSCFCAKPESELMLNYFEICAKVQYIFIEENAAENVICKMAAISFGPQCVT